MTVVAFRATRTNPTDPTALPLSDDQLRQLAQGEWDNTMRLATYAQRVVAFYYRLGLHQRARDLLAYWTAEVNRASMAVATGLPRLAGQTLAALTRARPAGHPFERYRGAVPAAMFR